MTVSGARPSATFRSTSPRFEERNSAASPGPIYDVADAREISAKLRNNKPSPGFRSTTPRFEAGHKEAAPSVGEYNPVVPARSGNIAAFRSTTTRFPERKTETPDIACYDVVDPRELRASKSNVTAPFRSRSERFHHKPDICPQSSYLGPSLPDDIGQLKTRKPSAAFKSTAPRFAVEPASPAPPVGLYNYEEHPRGNGKGSAAFKSTVQRFRADSSVTQSVPLYDVNDPRSFGASLRNKSKSSAFASSTPRFRDEIPRSITPGPYYEIDASGFGSKGYKGTSAFRSKSPRFPDRKPDQGPEYEVRYPTDIAVVADRRARI